MTPKTADTFFSERQLYVYVINGAEAGALKEGGIATFYYVYVQFVSLLGGAKLYVYVIKGAIPRFSDFAPFITYTYSLRPLNCGVRGISNYKGFYGGIKPTYVGFYLCGQGALGIPTHVANKFVFFLKEC